MGIYKSLLIISALSLAVDFAHCTFDLFGENKPVLIPNKTIILPPFIKPKFETTTVPSTTTTTTTPEPPTTTIPSTTTIEYYQTYSEYYDIPYVTQNPYINQSYVQTEIYGPIDLIHEYNSSYGGHSPNYLRPNSGQYIPNSRYGPNSVQRGPEHSYGQHQPNPRYGSSPVQYALNPRQGPTPRQYGSAQNDDETQSPYAKTPSNPSYVEHHPQQQPYNLINQSYVHSYDKNNNADGYNRNMTEPSYFAENNPHQHIGNYKHIPQHNFGENYVSPYQTIPGTYHADSYSGGPYSSGIPYNPNDIYFRYLTRGAYQYYSDQCTNHYGQTPQLSTQDIESAFLYANEQMQLHLQQYGTDLSPSDEAYILTLKQNEATFLEFVSQYIVKFKCLSKYHAVVFLPTVRIESQYTNLNSYGDNNCRANYNDKGLRCDENSRYRTIDGSCNNLQHPYWGKSHTCHIRLLPPDYADGLNLPRLSHNGHQLPNARLISNVIHFDMPFDSFYTHLKMSFGQFVNHDITNTPVYANRGEYSFFDCCKHRDHTQCMPIDVPQSSDDYLYSHYNATCLNFVRSSPCPLCEIGPRQQSNIAPAFIDLSAIYGNKQSDSNALRTFQFGLMITDTDVNGNAILPSTEHPFENKCSPSIVGMQCFATGDPRSNQHPALMAMHTVFVRRHNQHANALRFINPYWDDETLFQESRRITIAEFQMITFNEYFPIVFGPTLMSYFSLTVSEDGFTAYEPVVDPSTWNDYATASCRFGHSQIQNLFSVLTGHHGQYDNSQSYSIRDKFFDPSPIRTGHIDGIFRGLCVDPSKTVDPYFTMDIKNYLFRTKHELYGSDLIMRNIQRGRDHGIPGYVNYLSFCFGYDVNSWDDLNRFIPAEIVNRLREVYESFIDIDLYTGGISERHFPDADIGPTFACVNGIQYYHLKYGDRFYFEHGGQSGSFTLDQLNNIRRTTTLARLLCSALNNLEGIQPHVFLPQSSYNPKISCNDYTEMDYNLWKEIV